MIHPLRPFQSLATFNAIGLAYAVWRDRRELHFVEAIVAGRRESKMRRAQARRWRKRKTVPSGTNQAYPPAAPALPPGWQRGLPSSASMQDEQVNKRSAAPNGAAALTPATEATLSAYQGMVRRAALALADADEPHGRAVKASDDDDGMLDSIGGDDGELMAAPVLRGRGNGPQAGAADDDEIDSIGGGDGELMAAPVLRGRGNAALAAADDDDDDILDSMGGSAALAPATEVTLSAYQSRVRSAALALAEADEPQAGYAASAHVSAEVLDSTTPLSSPLRSSVSWPLPLPLPPPLLSSLLPSPLPSPPDRDARGGTDRSELSTTEADEASEASSVWLSEIALAEGSGVFDEEKDLMRGIVRAGNGMILSQMGPEVT